MNVPNAPEAAAPHLVENVPGQRWRERKATFRPRGEGFDPSGYGVELIGKTEASNFITREHYSGSMPPTSVRVGLYRVVGRFLRAELVGVCTFGGFSSQEVAPRWTGLPSSVVLQLSRLVLLDLVPYNFETWLLARAFTILRAERPQVRAVISYSDPVPRRNEQGVITMPGHMGAVYQAKGARYVGRSDAELKWLDQHGRLVDGRSLSKVRALDRDDPVKSKGGASYARTLVELGADQRRPLETWTAWVERITRGGEGPFRAMRHRGNHTYLFSPRGLGTPLPASVSPALPYPKAKDAA